MKIVSVTLFLFTARVVDVEENGKVIVLRKLLFVF